MTNNTRVFPQPINIIIPARTGHVTVIAYLLATIGRPPTSSNDRGWRETVSAYRRTQLEDEALAPLQDTTGAAPRFLEILPEDLLLGDQIRANRLQDARLGVDRATFAATVAAPEIVKRLHELLGEAPEALPRHARNPETRERRIERLLQAEDDSVVDRDAAAIPGAPRRLTFSGFASQMTPRNVQTRILRPAEPVLHLALALKLRADQIESALHRIHPDRAAWEREGLGTSPIRQPDGSAIMRPRLTERHLFQLGGLFADTIELAEYLRPLTEAYIRDGRRKDLRPMVCLSMG